VTLAGIRAFAFLHGVGIGNGPIRGLRPPSQQKQALMQARAAIIFEGVRG
jgi:hypothetical protein